MCKIGELQSKVHFRIAPVRLKKDEDLELIDPPPPFRFLKGTRYPTFVQQYGCRRGRQVRARLLGRGFLPFLKATSLPSTFH